ncbi:MAG: transporter, family, multidrug resistance protein [Mycobacterium sp.]|nr:transporter, family, multidrug resistance protein [Mycobacterium sp.]
MATSQDVDVVSVANNEAPSAPRAKMIAVLGALIALGPLTLDLYLPALPKITADLSVSSSVTQLTLTGTLAGLALGQLIVGPLSDSLGRRKPLIVGIVLHMVASVVCVFAPNIEILGAGRVLQGIGASAAMVVSFAVVGDLFDDSAAATVFSRLMLVLGAGPVIAPSLGAAVLLRASWHWTFAVLVVLAGALLVVAVFALPETLPPANRRPLRLRGVLSTYASLLRDVRFVTLVAVASLSISGLFAYISGASFVLQGHYGLTQQVFAIVFGAGAIWFIAATQVNVVLLKRFSPQTIVVSALSGAVVVGAVFVGLSMAHLGGLPAFLVPVWLVLAAMGLVIPNAPALALSRHHEAAGTAAALLGAGQFGVGALIAPLVGVLGNDEVALALVLAIGVTVALVALLLVIRLGDDEPLAHGPADEPHSE